MVYHFTKGCESGRQLLTDTLSAAPELGLAEVKHSTFFDAFQRFPTAWFASLLSFLLAAVVWKAIPELDALGKLYQVKLIFRFLKRSLNGLHLLSHSREGVTDANLGPRI